MFDKAVLAVVMDAEKDDALSILDRAAQKLSGRPDKDQGSKARVKSQGNGLKIFEVQYNPASLRLQGYGGAEISAGNISAGNDSSQTEQHVSPSSVSISLELDCEGLDTKKQVNGLVGIRQAARNPCVLFCWGENVFAGSVSEVRGEYTMFDRDGQPVRGKVNLTISRTEQP